MWPNMPYGIHNIVKGNPKILQAPLAHGHAHFFFWVGFRNGPWQTSPAANLEVATFSRYKNIKGETQNFGELP